MTREFAEKFAEQLECLGQNREKYIALSTPIKKENENDKTVTKCNSSTA